MDCFVATLLAMTVIGLNTTSRSRSSGRLDAAPAVTFAFGKYLTARPLALS